MGRHGQTWQVILADLALILFLTTLAGFVAVQEAQTATSEHTIVSEPQAIFRRAPGVSFADWLGLQQPDSRHQLTVFARYAEGDRQAVWEEARAMVVAAQAAGHASRVILEPAGTSDVYAALAYDGMAPIQ